MVDIWFDPRHAGMSMEIYGLTQGMPGCLWKYMVDNIWFDPRHAGVTMEIYS